MVALGIISQPRELVVIEVAIVLLAAQAFVINQVVGISIRHGVRASQVMGRLAVSATIN
jgi:hypothetical protein